MTAAFAILCCSHPSSVGVAHASKCAKFAATVCTVLAIFHLMLLAVFSVAVLPEVPDAVGNHCAKEMAPSESFYNLVGMADEAPHKHGGNHAGAHPAAAPPAYSTESAAIVVTSVATHASRKLEEVYQVVVVGEAAPEAASLATHCARVAQFFDEAAPVIVLFVALVQLCLALAASNLVKAANHLLVVARTRGVRGI